jgi:hypothetical protein
MLALAFTVRQAWEQNVATLAAPATWSQAGQAPLDLAVGYSVPRDIDQAIANALGVGVRMVTMRERDTAGRTPRRLDRLDVAGESLTIDYVTPVVLAGATIGWRCYCAGLGLVP